MFFDKEIGQIVSVKKEVDYAKCSFSKYGLDVQIADQAFLKPGQSGGGIKQSQESIEWDLSYSTNEKPLKLLPNNLYKYKSPKAKALVASPLATFNGSITVNSKQYKIDQWVGSDNHNWGSKHTDEYAWGQVAGFDNDQSAFLECATARIKIGPFKTPWITTLVLRYNGKEIAINSIWQGIKAKSSYNFYEWHFESKKNNVLIKGVIRADKQDFVRLKYYNPPGGNSICHNSKIASCKIIVKEQGQPEQVLITKHRAAFEILAPENISS